MRKVLAFIALLAPAPFIYFCGLTLEATSFLVAVETPDYALDKKLLPELTKEQLVAAAASFIERNEKLAEAANRKTQNDYAVYVYLSALLAIYAVLVSILLWRTAPNKVGP